MRVISSETQQPITGATFTLQPYRSMFRKGGLNPDRPLGESCESGELQFKLNSRDDNKGVGS